MFHVFSSITNMLFFVVDMSSEGTSKRTRKRNKSPASRDKSNESRRLRYQQNKDTINEHRRAKYRRRTTETTLKNYFMVPPRYRTMDDIMERTFPLGSSLPEYAPRQHNFVFQRSPENYQNIEETSHNREEHHVHNVDANVHPNPSVSAIASCEKGQRLQNIHGGGNDDIVCDALDDSLIGHLFDNLDPAGRNIISSNLRSENNVVQRTETVIPDSSPRGTMEVIQ